MGQGVTLVVEASLQTQGERIWGLDLGVNRVTGLRLNMIRSVKTA